jgi:hypothetical protein
VSGCPSVAGTLVRGSVTSNPHEPAPLSPHRQRTSRLAAAPGPLVGCHPVNGVGLLPGLVAPGPGVRPSQLRGGFPCSCQGCRFRRRCWAASALEDPHDIRLRRSADAGAQFTLMSRTSTNARWRLAPAGGQTRHHRTTDRAVGSLAGWVPGRSAVIRTRHPGRPTPSPRPGCRGSRALRNIAGLVVRTQRGMSGPAMPH